MLTRVLPNSVTSGMTRTATKPMIDNLGSMPMTEGMFGGDPEEATCAICLGDYRTDETIRFLPCQHHFHLECVDQWLMTDKSWYDGAQTFVHLKDVLYHSKTNSRFVPFFFPTGYFTAHSANTISTNLWTTTD